MWKVSGIAVEQIDGPRNLWSRSRLPHTRALSTRFLDPSKGGPKRPGLPETGASSASVERLRGLAPPDPPLLFGGASRLRSQRPLGTGAKSSEALETCQRAAPLWAARFSKRHRR